MHRGFKRLLFLLAVSVISPISSFNAFAAENQSPQILSIDVAGNHVVENETILARIESRVGQPLSRKTVSQDVRRLFKSGDFSDVRVEGSRSEKGVRLIYRVKEYPLIAQLNLHGNEKVKSKDLKLRLKLKPGLVFSPDYIKQDRNNIRKSYLKKGYYQVQIDFVSKPLADGRVDVDINIHEGDVTRIQRIGFIGNHAFSATELSDAIASRKSDLITWFNDRDVFDQKRFGADGQMLLQHYQNNGYIDARLESSRLAMSEDKQHFDLTFALSEGPQYRVENVSLKGDIVPDEQTLLKLVTLEKGAVYSLQKLRDTVQALTERVGDEGFAFATVTPLFKRNLLDNTVAVELDIEKGREVYIERIEIAGNEKTVDKVVRRSIKQSEAARFSASQINRSKEELTRSPLYEDVRVSLPRGSDSNKVKLKLDVTEKKSGSFTFGVGYSQVEKVIFNTKLSENNLFGKGYQANLNGTFGAKTQNFTTDFTDPYFLGKNMSATVNAFKSKTDPLSQVTYTQKSQGGGIGFGIPLSDHLSYTINYQYSSTSLSGILPTASILLRAQQGTQTVGELSQSLSWDSRNKFIGPTDGHQEILRASVAGLGGSNRFWEVAASTTSYFPFGEDDDFVVNPSFEGKMINGYSGRNILLNRRYSMGGIGTVRGFDSYGISLRDPNGEAIGGDRQIRASLNLFTPIPYMKTAGFRGVFFADAGTLWGKVSATIPGSAPLAINESFALSKVRSSAGFGVEWVSPVGPISFVWGFPIHKASGDVVKNFEFAVGGSF